MKKFFIIFVIITFFLYGEDKILVLVGSKPIFEKDVFLRAKRDKIDYKTSLKFLIEENLLLYQAEKNKIEVSKEEIKNEIERIKRNFSSIQEFYEYLKESNMSFSQFENEIINTLKIRKLIRNEIISKIEISPIEIAREMEKIENEFNEYEFFFKWFDKKEDSEKFVENFDSEDLKEMEYVKLKSSEIIDEILNEIKKVEKDKIIPPIKIGEKWIVVYLKDKKQLEINKIEKYKEIKEKLFKTKYSILYRNYIETLSNTIPIKFL